MAQLMHYIEIDQRRQTAVRENISLWEGVLVLAGQYIHTSRESKQQNIAFERIFHFGRVYWSWKANTYIRAERSSHNNSLREYFTLGGCAGPERQIHRASHNNNFEREYFTLGGCAGPGRPIQHTSKESKPQ